MRSWALRPLPVPGGGQILGCVPAPCAPGLRCWIRSRPRRPHRGAAARAPSAAPGPAVRAAALRELGALSWARSCCYCPREPEGIPFLLGPAPTPCEPLSAREGRCSSCSSGTGLSCPGDTRPGLSPAPRGAPPPWRPLFLYFFFPSSYLDRSANSSHCCIPGVLSLILRPN